MLTVYRYWAILREAFQAEVLEMLYVRHPWYQLQKYYSAISLASPNGLAQPL